MAGVHKIGMEMETETFDTSIEEFNGHFYLHLPTLCLKKHLGEEIPKLSNRIEATVSLRVTE